MTGCPTALEAARRIADGSLTSEALVRACLDRISEREPLVQAWQHLDIDAALNMARHLDQFGSGPLKGIPVGVKDIIDTADMPTGYGSPLYETFRPPRDAACVALARHAGALILGKTVTTEFAYFQPGKTRNPHNPDRTPGGSSSSSAAAVASGMVPLAFGTQTAGSIIRPASFCGCVGYKPTFGLSTALACARSQTVSTRLGFLQRPSRTRPSSPPSLRAVQTCTSQMRCAARGSA